MTNDLDFPCLQMQVFVHSNGSPVVAPALEQGVGRGGRGMEVHFTDPQEIMQQVSKLLRAGLDFFSPPKYSNDSSSQLPRTELGETV